MTNDCIGDVAVQTSLLLSLMLHLQNHPVKEVTAI